MSRYRMLTEHQREDYPHSSQYIQYKEYDHKSRSHHVEPELYAQELREVLYDKRKNYHQHPQQHSYAHVHSTKPAVLGKSVPINVEQVKPLYLVESPTEERAKLPKIKKKYRNEHSSAFNQNEKLIIRNYLNAKLVQFRKPLPKLKSKNKSTSHVASSKEIESQFERKSPQQKYIYRESHENYEKTVKNSHDTILKRIRTEPRISEDEVLKKMPYPSYLGNRFGNSYKMLLDDRYVSDSNVVEKERNFVVEDSEEEFKQSENWNKPDALGLETEFAKGKNQENSISDIFKQARTKAFIPEIPNEDQIDCFLESYTSEWEEIDLLSLRKEPNFEILEYVEENKKCFYFGQTKNELKHGKGVLICDKTIFEGIWRYGEKVKGVEKTEIGKYKGEFEEGKREGKGEFFWNHGEYYSGQWKKGKKNGSGYWKSEKGESYIGEWVNGEVSGYGVHTLEKGHKYEGEFLKFLKHGFGKEVFTSGDIYEGRYEQGEAHGKGKYQWKNGTVYEGSFVLGSRNGKGYLSSPGDFEFEGVFKDDLICGIGKLKLANGDTFNGMFENSKKNGFGVYNVKSEGVILKGIWSDNELIKEEV